MTDATNDPMEQAAQVRSEHQRRAEDITGNADLHDEAKRRQLAELTEDTGAELRRLHQAATDADAAEQDELVRGVFGSRVPFNASAADQAAVQSAYTTALDRAEQVTSTAEALRLLARCADTGDKTFARALAYRAFKAGWPGVVSTWGEHFAGADDRSRLERLAAARAEGEDITRKMARRLATSVPPIPSR